MRSSFRYALVLALLPAMPEVALATEKLDAAGIKSLISGRTVRLDTPFGIALPLRYRSDGIVAGDISGISMASMFAPKEEGRWWVAGNRLCQKWPSWYKGRQFCFEITRTGDNRISWLRDDGATGTATIAE